MLSALAGSAARLDQRQSKPEVFGISWPQRRD
jgi:hypothetical protein